MSLLTADLHLSDKPADAYRWNVFSKLREYADGEIYILGDLADRADRHSSVLVNRLITELTNLTDAGNIVTILCGNHDLALKPPPYWQFLSILKNVNFIVEPTEQKNDLLLLPYAANPKVDWAEIDFKRYKAVFMHQTVTGVDAGNGRILENRNMVEFAVNNIVYSGDIHTPQTIGQVTYVGAPHPTNFGDSYKLRFLKLDADYRAEEIPLQSIQKRMIDISSLEELKAAAANSGDQARIRFRLPMTKMDQWPVEEQSIAAWAQKNGVTLASVEAIVEMGPVKAAPGVSFDADPEVVLAAFCKAEGIAEDLYQTGLKILRENRSL